LGENKKKTINKGKIFRKKKECVKKPNHHRIKKNKEKRREVSGKKKLATIEGEPKIFERKKIK
jgi:hypothetical protein